MSPLDKENLAYEQTLIHTDDAFRIDDIDRPPPPPGPCPALRDPYQRAQWSKTRYNFDTIGQERSCVTHGDGHSIMWISLRPSDAFLIAPDGAVIHTHAAYIEARRFAAYWGAP